VLHRQGRLRGVADVEHEIVLWLIRESPVLSIAQPSAQYQTHESEFTTRGYPNGKPERHVAYLAGPEAGFITSASLTIDGGFTA